MSDLTATASLRAATRPARRGQALVELAILMPLLLLLLLGAIDFGRIFFGWVAVNNASRIAANYAATHPDAWALSNTEQQAEYAALVRQSGANNCGLDEQDPPPPTFPDGTRELGDRVRVDLSCEFDLVNPFLQPLIGPYEVSASSVFNVRQGCVACEPVAAGPPPPAQNHCRLVPNMVGTSVGGAKLKWEAAGFTGAFEPITADDWRTVSHQSVDQGDVEGCTLPYAFFTSSVLVTLASIDEPEDAETCLTVPNVLGMTVAGARAAWDETGFDPDRFTPDSGVDDQIVSSVAYTPSEATHGQCQEPDVLEIEVQYVPPPPPPPDAPCKVPSFVNTLRADAQGTWEAAGFTGAISYQGGNWTVIGRQEPLVGGSYVVCSSTIRLFR